MSERDNPIGGGAELDRLLQTLPANLEKNIMRAALRAGAAEFLPVVKAKIPVDQGDLRNSARITTRYRKGQVTASVKVGDRIAYYARMVEYGTRQHLIKVDDRDRGVNRRTGNQISVTTINRQQRGSLVIGGNLVGPSVVHPGARPHPFMRPAADEAFPQAVAAVERKVRERLTRQGLETPAPLPPDPEE